MVVLVIACRVLLTSTSIFFFFNDTATTEIYTLSLHDALPIFRVRCRRRVTRSAYLADREADSPVSAGGQRRHRSEEHTSELQSRLHLVCRLLLEKKKTIHTPNNSHSRP